MAIDLEGGWLATVLLLFPIVFMLHDLEEIVTVERYLTNNRSMLESRLPGWAYRFMKPSLAMTTHKFTVNVIFVYLLILLVTLPALFFSYYSFYLAALHVFFLHVFTHVGQSLLVRRYTPGVVTAVCLVLPYSVWAYLFLYHHHILTLDTGKQSVLLLAVGLPAALGLLLWARKKQTAGRH
jgi:hypothetical protein